MKENNFSVEKSYAFALRIVKLYWFLIETILCAAKECAITFMNRAEE